MSKSRRTNRKPSKKSATTIQQIPSTVSLKQLTKKGIFLRLAVLILLTVVGCIVWLPFPVADLFRGENGDSTDLSAVNNITILENLSPDELEKLLKLPGAVSNENEATDIDLLRSLLEESIQTLTVDFPKDAQAEHLYGLFQLRLKRTTLAEPSLRRCVELAPDNQQMRMDLADLLTQLGRDDEALNVLESCPATSQLQVEFLWRLGDSQLRFGHLDAAERTLTMATKSSPEQSALWVQLGKVQLQQQNVDDALASAKKAIEFEPNEPEVWLLLNRISAIRKQTSEAQDALNRWRELKEKANGIHPNMPFEIKHPESMAKFLGSAFRSLANLHQSKGNTPMAQAMFERALQAEPQDAVTIADWAGLQRRVRNFDKARDLNLKLLQLKPLEVVHYQNLANVLMEMNRPLDAEVSLRLACIRVPENGNGHLLLARFLLLANKPKEAVAPARTALQILNNAETAAVLIQSQNAAGRSW